MTRDQFNRLLRNPSTIDLNFISDLEEITRRFPYFTNAHILLAKQYHGHENIKYESHLRKASAYAPDRTLLYHLIRKTPDAVIHIAAPAAAGKAEEILLPVPEPTVPFAEIPAESTPVTGSSETAEIILPEETAPVAFDHSETQSTLTDTEQDVHEPANSQTKSPLEIIEKRLRELEGRVQEEEKSAGPAASEPVETDAKPTGEVAVSIADKKEEILPDSKSPLQQNPPAESQVLRIEKGLRDSDTAPAIREEPYSAPSHPAKVPTEHPEESKASKTSKNVPITHSFSEWLKIKSIPVIAAENIGEFLLRDKSASVETENTEHQPDLVEKFIKSEPRIVPGKSEFYSPGNMARKSAMEHEDLISETLARIYAQQGNIPKAIDAYQRLSLKNPEKSAYFAALIKELEKPSEG